ncbi:hypothetical protein [Nitrosomonas sp.]|uniref:hypothetical protein n=1 Tax=Nitrosomonas sp. TaxID=42353 RepID=UPI0025F06D7A|nr:hypothetical protein [Nitrosomonas sp.]MBV6446866.1 hypothetical protein [Nitrosomonas sp.]
MNTKHQLPLTVGLPVPIGKVISTKQTDANFITKLGISILLSMMVLVITPITHAANLLFKSNFGKGVVLNAPTAFSTNAAWQPLTGTDSETGYSWPVAALGSDLSAIQLIAVDPITPDTIGSYITNEIRSVTGPKGTAVNELFQNVKIKAPVGTGGSQAPLMIKRPSALGDVNDLYITYWFKYPADFPDKLDNTVSAGNWRTQFEFKTGGYNGNNSAGDYRIGINILKGADGALYWRSFGDNQANIPWSKIEYWAVENHTVAVPVDKWFKFEVYWHRSSGSDGRIWAAVDGQEIVDHYGPNMGDYNLPITRIFVNNAYSGGYATVESHSTGLEIWDGFPCGDGVSCLGADSVAPTVPASLVAALKTTTTTTKVKGKTKSSSSALVTLSWSASSDNVAVAGYNVYRNGTKIAVSTSTGYTDSLGTATGAIYSYTVKAFDAAGNISTASNVASIVN